MRPRSAVPLLCAAAVGALVAGCGSNSQLSDERNKSAQQILTDAQDALRSAGSLHLKEKIVPHSGAAFDLTADVVGRDRLRVYITERDAPLTITFVSGRVYFSGKRYWEKSASPGVAELFGDRCVLVPPGAPGQSDLIQGLTSIADIDTLAARLTPSGGKSTKGGVTKLGSAQAIPLAIKTDTEQDSVYVSAVDKPYPLKLVTATSDATTIVELSQYGNVSFEDPKNCIDASRLSTSPSTPKSPSSSPSPSRANTASPASAKPSP